MHLNDEQVAALVHDNLASPALLISAITHESWCKLCSERVEAEQAIDMSVGQLLCAIDHPQPATEVRDVIRRARVRSARRAVLALILVVGGATAASAAIPGTPIHNFLNRARPHAAPAAAPTPGAIAPAASAGSNAVSIVPHDGLVVVLPQISRGSVSVRLTDSGTARLSSSDPRAAYTLEEDRIVVRSMSSAAEYELSLPAALQAAQVTVGGRVLYARENGVTRCTGTESDATCVIEFGVTQR